MSQKIAIIIGAGPAGLTAAYELLKNTDVHPVVVDRHDIVGGLSRTLTYKGNHFDIGPHRYFTKSTRVQKLWNNLLTTDMIDLENERTAISNVTGHFLRCQRLTRILFLGQLLDYPLRMDVLTLRQIGMQRVLRMAMSLLKTRIFPIQQEKSLEDFLINRFGRELYQTFFKDYTEKVWGVTCQELTAEWGVQRIKGLSLEKAVKDSLVRLANCAKYKTRLSETSLIKNFYYPQNGSGQMWQLLAECINAKGAQLLLNYKVTDLVVSEKRVREVCIRKNKDCSTIDKIPVDYVFSSMPVKDLIASFKSDVPERILSISKDLPYREHIEVALLIDGMKKLKKQMCYQFPTRLPDHWIYIQDSDVKMGRVQVFNNWSPYLVKNVDSVWLGVEYFCSENDELWCLSDDQLIELAVKELELKGLIESKAYLDGVVVRTKKAYPGYYGSYKQFGSIKEYLNQFENMYLIGRNGMHRYNNMDHSVLSAMAAVDCLRRGISDREQIWNVNTEKEYHESS